MTCILRYATPHYTKVYSCGCVSCVNNRINTTVTVEDIIASIPLKAVVARTTKKPIVASTPDETIISIITSERISNIIASQGIITTARDYVLYIGNSVCAMACVLSCSRAKVYSCGCISCVNNRINTTATVEDIIASIPLKAVVASTPVESIISRDAKEPVVAVVAC